MEKLKNFKKFSNIIEISSNFAEIDAFLRKNLKKRKIFISDEKIWKNCQKFFAQNFLDNFDEILLLKNPKADDKNLKKISQKLGKIDLIFALGSGTINDLCKFSAANHNISYIICASAASMNGYLSKNASITINSHKKTLKATLPKKVFCNLEILKNAPIELTKAGVGDVMCFYSCYFDWFLSHAILQTEFNEVPFEILQQKMQFLINNYAKFSIKSEEFLQILIEILMISGIGMSLAGSSNPASQSEHLIAHVLDMKYPKISAKLLHGQVIATTSLTAAKKQGELLELLEDELIVNLKNKANQLLQDKKLFKDFEQKLINFCGKNLAKSCLEEYLAKLQLIKNAKSLKKADLKKLEEIYFSAEKLKKIFTHFKVKTSTKSLGFNSKEYEEAVKNAAFIRNRFTCLDFDIVI